MSQLVISGYQVKPIDIVILIAIIILIVVVTRKTEGAKVIPGTLRPDLRGLYDGINRKLITENPPPPPPRLVYGPFDFGPALSPPGSSSSSSSKEILKPKQQQPSLLSKLRTNILSQLKKK